MRTIDELKKLGVLKDHNIPTYLQLEELFENGENRVGVVQATGTGKSFVAFQFLYDNVFKPNKDVDASKEGYFTKNGQYKRKRAVVLEPRDGIVFHFKDLCEELCQNLNVPFDDVTVVRYDQLKLLTDEELKFLDFDYIILDEFHRLGAEGRGTVTQRLLEANPNAKVLGFSATPIRYLDKKRDMGDELFGENIVRGLNLAEAISEKVLPNPEYIMAVRSYEGTAKIIEDKINAIKDKKTRELYEKELRELRRHPEYAKGLKETFERKIKNKNGKFIAFCTDIEKMQSLRNEIEKGLLSGVNKNVKIYQISYKDKKEDVTKIIKEFEQDHTNCFKIMLAVDMFNEGIHVSDMDGCFLFRPTISPEIYTQQIGRVLSVRNDQNFQPQIFDIVDNLQSYEKMLLAFEAERTYVGRDGNVGYGGGQSIIPFKITGSDEDLYNRLRNLYDLVSNTLTTKEKWLAAAERYAHENGNLNMVRDYIEEGTELKIGQWLYDLRRRYNVNKKLVNEKIAKKLSKLDEHWFEYTKEYHLAERDRKIIEGVSTWNKNELIPNYAVSPVDKSFKLGAHLIEIKQFLKGKNSTKYSQELIDKINEINPYALKTREQMIAERDEKIIEGVRAWGKNKPIPNRQMSPVDKTFKLGSQIDAIKLFINGKKITKYSQELIDKINEINPYVLNTREENLVERDKKIIEGVRAWGQNRPIPDREKSPVDESFKLGVQIAMIKKFLKGNGGTKYSRELIDKINEINPYVLKTQEEMNNERDKKIIEGVRAWQKGKILSQKETSPVEKSFKLGTQIMQIKRYMKGNNSVKYSQELIDEINKINPDILRTKGRNKE